MARQNLSSERSVPQRVMSRIGRKEPGQLSIWVKIALYLLLVALVLIDYTVLSQAFVLLQQSLSRNGTSVGATVSFVVLLVSFAAVALPHLVAWSLQRRSVGFLPPTLSWLPWTCLALWLLLLGMVTFIRITAAATPLTEKANNATVPVPGASTTPVAPVTAVTPDVSTIDTTQLILAFVMLLVLIISAVVAYVVAIVTHNPVHNGLRASEARLTRAQADAAARDVEMQAAVEVQTVARQANGRDFIRFGTTGEQTQSLAEGLRAEIRTILAASLGSPDATSHLIRELRRRYPRASRPTPLPDPTVPDPEGNPQ